MPLQQNNSMHWQDRGYAQLNFCDLSKLTRHNPFRYCSDADRFYRVLPKRLNKYNLEVESSKTKILLFNRFHPSRKRERVFEFLGFEYSWRVDRKKKPRVLLRTSPKKLKMGLSRIKEWVKRSRHLPKRHYFDTLNRKLRGHYNYYYLRGNSSSVWLFYRVVVQKVFKWLNRRSHKASYTWEQYNNLLGYMNIATPKVPK